MTEVRRRVLLVAYACRPGATSEREVGWRWANLIQERHDVWVLTRRSNAAAIEAEFRASGAASRPRFVYYDLPRPLLWLKRRLGLLRSYYVLWSLFAVMHARRLHRRQRFDLTHFLTFGTLLWPQFAFLMPTRYVLGPVGGGERIPSTLGRAFSWRARLGLGLRRWLQRGCWLDPIRAANLMRADCVLARTAETYEMLPPRVQARSEVLLETAVDARSFAAAVHPATGAAKSGENPASVSIVTVARLVPSKAIAMALHTVHAFRKTHGLPFRFEIIGDGPERARLEALREELGLDEVRFVGSLPRATVAARLAAADVYLSTTTKEAGSWAFFEAIEARLPIVCLKVNGPDLIVGDDAGIKVEPRGYDETVAALGEALARLARDPELRTLLAERAAKHVLERFTWQRVADRVDAVYARALGDETASGEVAVS